MIGRSPTAAVSPAGSARPHTRLAPPRGPATAAVPRLGLAPTGRMPWEGGQRDEPRIAVIDGPYSSALSTVLAREPISLGHAGCSRRSNGACRHGTFILGLLGARDDAPIPGLCPRCEIFHLALFADESTATTTVGDLAAAIDLVVSAGASLINLSLVILGNDVTAHDELVSALDRAQAAGAIVMAAAGNQGRAATSRILSHPVTVPVVAVDEKGELLPDCNFGALISRRGVSAFGDHVRGYAPDGGLTAMSGTSVATAVATGVVAQAWMARPGAKGADIRSAVASLSPRAGPTPPALAADALLEELDRVEAKHSVQAATAARVSLDGGKTMSEGNGQREYSASFVARAASAESVAPGGGSACGGCSSGACSCSNGGSSPSGFVYVLGTVDVQFPDQSVADEFQDVARTKGREQRDDEPLRSWCHRVLTDGAGDKPGPRYISRQLCFILKVEKLPAYYLVVRDWDDLDDLIQCLGEPDGHDLTLVVGSSSMNPVEKCAGVVAPVLLVEQICAYKEKDLIDWCETAETPPSKTRKRGAKSPGTREPVPERLFEEVYRALVSAADNYGNTDEWRALNYLAIRCRFVYQLYTRKVAQGQYRLESLRVVKSRLWGERRIVDPVFSFVNLQTGVLEKYFFRVDVTYLFPSLLEMPVQFDVPNYFDR